MKHVFFLLVAFLSLSNINAQQQILNPGFEDWTMGPVSPTPDYYACVPGSDTSANPTIIRSTSAHSGQFAALLKNQLLFSTYVQQAYMLYGSWQPFVGGTSVGAGLPFQSRPLRMKVWYKYNKTAQDTGSISVQVTKWSSFGSLLVGYGELVIPNSVPNYTQAFIDMYYVTADIPDSIIINFSATYSFTAGAGTELYVDDIEMEYFPSTINNLGDSPINLYPNPCSNKLYFSLPSSGSYRVTITDMTGKEVSNAIAAGPKTELDISHLSAGMYFVRLTGGNGHYSGKFMKEQ